MATELQSVLNSLLLLPENKTCVDCDDPCPQWASVSYGTFFCLNCSGSHRSLGVHLSFVRSVKLDKWSEPQVQKMKLGGNAKWRRWCEEEGKMENYSRSMNFEELYNTHFAAQYRDKLAAEAEGRLWSPSQTPLKLKSDAGQGAEDSETQSAIRRKTRPNFSERVNSTLKLGSSSKTNTNQTSNLPTSLSKNQKAENEAYFSGLSNANANRREDLPPSQGGKYVGFGSGPSNPLSNSQEGAGDEWTEVPGAILSKGWGLLSSTLNQASKAFNDPGANRGTAEQSSEGQQTGVSSETFSSAQVWSLANRFQQTVLDVTKVGSGYAAEGLKLASQQAKIHGFHIGDLGSQHLQSFGAGEGLRPCAGSRSSSGYSPVDPSYNVPDHHDDGEDETHSELPGAVNLLDSLSWEQMAPRTAAIKNSSASSSGKTEKVDLSRPLKQKKSTEDDGWAQW